MESSSKNFSVRLNEVSQLAQQLSKEIIDKYQLPDTERCLDLLKKLEEIDVNTTLLEKTNIGKILGKANKTLKRHRRTAPENITPTLEEMIETSDKIIQRWKINAEKEAKSHGRKGKESARRLGLPSTVAEYRARLVSQNKELHKDPPVLPPSKVENEMEKCPIPNRSKNGEALTFVAGKDCSIKNALKDFHPNRTPEGK
jgi:hypothetical protein